MVLEHPKHVLVVEDEPLIRGLLVDVLRTEGYAVAEACNGLDALQCLARQRPDVIVLDVMMPVMDGRTFARSCHAFSPSQPIPILLVSASPTLWRTAEQLRCFGIRGFVAKPFDLNILIDAVAQLVEPAELLATVK